MTDDRELLELAAKAAGHTLKFEIEGNGSGEAITHREVEVAYIRWEESPTHYGYTYWNPLTDDGDALRLAVKLGLQVECEKRWDMTNVTHKEIGPVITEHYTKEFGPDQATRRAIVRAAAEMGRAVP